MKVGDWTPAAVCNVFSLDIEVLKAQRMAELKDLAEYRERHLALIKDWSKDKDLVYQKLGIDPGKDTADLKSQQELLAESVRYGAKPLTIRTILRALPPPVRKPWWQRFFSALFAIFEAPMR